MELYAETFRATVVLVTASVVLAGPGFLGMGVSLSLVAGLVVLAGVLFVVREQLATLPTVVGHDLGSYGTILWLAPVVGLVVCLLAFDATAGELQSLGGLVGLAGMVNYFLRPVYQVTHALARRVARIAG